jgi:hypothetical protein
MSFEANLVLPLFLSSKERSPESSSCTGSEQSLTTRQSDLGMVRRKPNFPERLWQLAKETGQNPELFWSTGVMFADDHLHIYYCAHVLSNRLGVRQATIAHDMRGYRGEEKSNRMTKHLFQQIFGQSRHYQGQVWIVRIPGLTVHTSDFRNFRWEGRVELCEIAPPQTEMMDHQEPSEHKFKWDSFDLEQFPCEESNHHDFD